MATYDEFTRIFLYIFERRDPEISFREFSHVKQTRTLQAYIFKFYKLVFMATDISKSSLILLFITGLVEPLKFLVESYIPSTLQEALNRTRDLQDVISRIRFPRRMNAPSQFKNQRPPMKIHV